MLPQLNLKKRIVLTAFLLIIIGLGTYIYIQWYQQTSLTYETVDAKSAKEIIDSNPDLIILDVRTEEEYSTGHIEDAVNIPLHELEERLHELDRGKKILVYCRSGVRSVSASEILIENGFLEVYNMDGGIIAWEEAGYQIIAEHVIVTETSTSPHSQTTMETSTSTYSPTTIILRKTFPLNASFENINGSRFQIEDYKGKIVIVNLMFTGCGVCKNQTSHLKKTFNQFHGDVIIISVSVYPEQDTRDVLRRYKEDNEAHWIWARDVEDIGRTHLNIHVYPTTFILDREGRIGYRHEGPMEAMILTSEIEQLLKE